MNDFRLLPPTFLILIALTLANLQLTCHFTFFSNNQNRCTIYSDDASFAYLFKILRIPTIPRQSMERLAVIPVLFD